MAYHAMVMVVCLLAYNVMVMVVVCLLAYHAMVMVVCLVKKSCDGDGGLPDCISISCDGDSGLPDSILCGLADCNSDSGQPE